MTVILPDLFIQASGNGYAQIAANKKARRVLNKGFEGGRPSWRKIAKGNLTSPEYRAIEIDSSPVVAVMLVMVHEAGLAAMFWCENCGRPHSVDEDMAVALWQLAKAGSTAALPAHETVQ